MMTFGWSPQQSCYVPSGGASSVGPASTATTTDQQSAVQSTAAAMSCQAPTWWYSLLAIAAMAGFAARGKA